MNPYDSPTVPNDTCEHPQAEHFHGTHACYVLDRCRCLPCSRSNARYERSRAKWLAGVVPHPLVEAEPARQKALELMDGGMSLKRIAKVSGVAQSSLGKLVYGIPTQGRPPSKKVHRETAAKILDCPLDVADGARVDGREARRIVAELVKRGWWKAEISRRITGNPNAYALQRTNKSKQVTAGTLRALRRLLTEPVPKRVHAPTGKMYDPSTGHWGAVNPTTPGVPADDTLRARGELACTRCGEALATHPIGACMPTAISRAVG